MKATWRHDDVAVAVFVFVAVAVTVAVVVVKGLTIHEITPIESD